MLILKKYLNVLFNKKNYKKKKLTIFKKICVKKKKKKKTHENLINNELPDKRATLIG